MIPQKFYFDHRNFPRDNPQLSPKLESKSTTDAINQVVRYLLTSKCSPEHKWIPKFFQPITQLDSNIPPVLTHVSGIFELSYYVRN